MSEIQVKNSLTMLCARVQTMLSQRRRKQQKAPLEISAPFDFKLEPVSLPGVSEEEIAILREKAAASRIGIAEALPCSPSYIRSRTAAPSVVTVMPPYAAISSRPVW